MDFRQLPEQTPRVETGAIRFGKDWTGTFLRGDDSFGYALQLRYLLTLLKAQEPIPNYLLIVIASLASTLEESNEATN